MAAYGADAARADGHAAVEGGVAHQALQKQRQEGRGAVEHNAHDSNQQRAQGKIAVGQHAQVDQGMRQAEFPTDERDERNHRDERGPANPRRIEPVVLLPTVEDHLQRAQPEGHDAEANGVDVSAAAIVGGGR